MWRRKSRFISSFYADLSSQRLCSRITGLWRYINFVLILLLIGLLFRVGVCAGREGGQLWGIAEVSSSLGTRHVTADDVVWRNQRRFVDVVGEQQLRPRVHTCSWSQCCVIQCIFTIQNAGGNFPTNPSKLAAWLSGQDVGLWLADFPWSTPDPRLTCDHFVGKASAMGQPTRPTQPSIPSGSVNE